MEVIERFVKIFGGICTFEYVPFSRSTKFERKGTSARRAFVKQQSINSRSVENVSREVEKLISTRDCPVTVDYNRFRFFLLQA